jgi:hypothetical protein
MSKDKTDNAGSQEVSHTDDAHTVVAIRNNNRQQ